MAAVAPPFRRRGRKQGHCQVATVCVFTAKSQNADRLSALRCSWHARTRRAGDRIDSRRRRFQSIRAGGQLDFARVLRGLHDDLREAVEQAARPRRADGLPTISTFTSGFRPPEPWSFFTPTAMTLSPACSAFLMSNSRLRLPVVRFADALVVHENTSRGRQCRAKRICTPGLFKSSSVKLDVRAVNGRLCLPAQDHVAACRRRSWA